MQKLTYSYSELRFFRIFRTTLGVFLFYHFSFLFGHLDTLFSHDFLAREYAGFGNILTYLTSGPFLAGLNFIACLSSIFICLNFYRRISCAIILYIHYCYLQKNPMILNVSYDYLGWLLLAMIFIPPEDKNSKYEEWQIPSYILIGGWMIFGLGYSMNGFLKYQSPLWRDGLALSIIIPNDRLLANDLIRNTLLVFPDWILKGLTLLTTYTELFCLPLILFRTSRYFIWLIILILHLNALAIFKIKDLSLTMILFSLFLGISLNRKFSLYDYALNIFRYAKFWILSYFR